MHVYILHLTMYISPSNALSRCMNAYVYRIICAYMNTYHMYVCVCRFQAHRIQNTTRCSFKWKETQVISTAPNPIQ